MLKKFMTVGAALALSTASTMAAAAPISAAPLSAGKSVRASETVGKSDQLFGGTSIFILAIGAALIALGVVAIVDDDNDSPDSP